MTIDDIQDLGKIDMALQTAKIRLYVPGSKLVVLGVDIPPFIRNPYNGYINPYYWVDDHPLLYGNNGSLDPSTYNNHFAVRIFIQRGPVSTNMKNHGIHHHAQTYPRQLLLVSTLRILTPQNRLF